MSQLPKTRTELIEALGKNFCDPILDNRDVDRIVADALEICGLAPWLKSEPEQPPKTAYADVRLQTAWDAWNAGGHGENSGDAMKRVVAALCNDTPPPTETRREAWGEAEAKRLFSDSPGFPDKLDWEAIGDRARAAWLAIAGRAGCIAAEKAYPEWDKAAEVADSLRADLAAKDAELAELRRLLQQKGN